ncbi:MAG: hypothetical protein IJV15_15765 [Lachnospiraceae bacterium]|nr:hypothetical protein [Lachnospiraceae bacterium]
MAYDSEGNACQYFTRSAALQDRDTIFGVADNGVAGIGGVNGMDGPYSGGIRPAFCVPADTKIELSDEILEGQSVYIIKF